MLLPGDQENRRQVFLQLTARFAALTQEIFGPVIEQATGQLEQFSDHEVEVLLSFFADGHDRRVKRTALVREQTARQAAQDTGRGAEETP